MTKSIRTLFLVAVLLAVAGALPAADTIRAGRFGASASLFIGDSGGDPAAQLSLEGEYSIDEYLSVGAGYSYVDDYFVQLHSVSLTGKLYLFGWPIDLFVAPVIQIPFAGGSPASVVMAVRYGVEWQTPWLAFVGAGGAFSIVGANVGYMFGGYIGLRL